MSEPAWKAELHSDLDRVAYSHASLESTLEMVLPHIEAAYQRGLQAGRSQGRYTTGRKKWKKEGDGCTADAEGRTPASNTADEPPEGAAP